MKLNKQVICFTGGGTAGHIYPGLAVAQELKQIVKDKNNNLDLNVIWIGCSKGMDNKIVQSSNVVNKFYGIPSGKLRRYFSFQNFLDIFKIFAGFISAFFILIKTKPVFLFSKGGFVSVPPCIAAKILRIPIFTHECDYTLGLANKINFKFATNMFVSYEQTKKNLNDNKRIMVTGNPVRPIFYNTNKSNGYKFLGLDESQKNKPVLLILGGSSGARQINTLVQDNLDWLCQKFYVVHQTGLVNNNQKSEDELKEHFKGNYFPYNFIYEQMPDVLSCCDIVISRSGANSIWECAVLNKPMVLIPLSGNGTRGDQVDNARYFESVGASQVLVGQDANELKLKEALINLLNKEYYNKQVQQLKKLVGSQKPSQKIAEILYNQINY